MTQLIIGLFLTIIGSIVGVIDKWKNKTEDEYKRRNRISAALAIVSLGGGFIAFSAGVDAIHANSRNDKIANERQQRIDSQNVLIYRSELANQNLIDMDLQYSMRLDSSTKLNYLLSAKIAKQATDLNDYMTGKGSFCYFDLGSRDPNTNNYHFMLYSAGKNPMDNVVARIVDVLNIDNVGMGFPLHIGKVFPKIHTVRMFQTSYTPVKRDSIWLNIFFQTNGREFVEELKEVYINNKWNVHMEVDEEGKVLLNRTDHGFPVSWLK
jgi:hypothetical protein